MIAIEHQRFLRWNETILLNSGVRLAMMEFSAILEKKNRVALNI
jgi:hypothetical protein